jgi:hypothetical protein
MESTAQSGSLALEIINETASTGDAWIRQGNQPLWPQKPSTKTESLSTQKPSMEMLPRVTHGFDSANSTFGLRNHQRNCIQGLRMDSTAQTALEAAEIINETAYTGDEWIRQCKQPLWPQKSSMKLLPQVMHGFHSANSPYGLKHHQRNCFNG